MNLALALAAALLTADGGVALLEPGLAPSSFPRAGQAPSAEQQARLEALTSACEAGGCSALLVLRDGEVLVDRTFGVPRRAYEVMSITKTLTALAVGLLVEEGKLSLQAPACTWLPQWRDDARRAITVEQLLRHTAGLEVPAGMSPMFNQSDQLAYALARPLVAAPGATFAYSNEGAMALAAVIESAGGETAQALLTRRLLAPLGIDDFLWRSDRAGHPLTYAGVSLTAEALARLGTLLLHEGRWGGAQLAPASWVRAMQEPGPQNPSYGLLTWLVSTRGVAQSGASLAASAARGLPFTSRLMLLNGGVFPDGNAWLSAARRALGTSDGQALLEAVQRGARPWEGPAVVGFKASGYLGQELVVLPTQRLVAVRQRDSKQPNAAAREAAAFKPEAFARQVAEVFEVPPPYSNLAQDFLDTACAAPPQQFGAAWLAHEDRHWSVYRALYYRDGASEAERAQLARELGPRQAELCGHARAFVSVAPAVVASVRERIAALTGVTPRAQIVFTAALQWTDGNATALDDGPALALNARHDTFATTQQLAFTVAHELMHVAHDALDDGAGALPPVAEALYREGAAVFAVEQLFPEAGDAAAHLKRAELEQLKRAPQAAAGAVLEALRSTKREDRSSLFSGGQRRGALPPRAGYWVGLRLYRALAQSLGSPKAALSLGRADFLARAQALLPTLQ